MNSHEVDTDKVDISDTIDEAETKYIDISGSGSGIHRIIQYSILTMYRLYGFGQYMEINIYAIFVRIGG